jgi:exosortase
VNWRRLGNVGWTKWHIVGAVALALVGALATWIAWADIYHIAVTDEEASHILLVPVVAAWMFWVRRARIRYCCPSGVIIGPAIVAVGIAMYIAGFEYAVQSLWHAGAVTVVIGCALSVLGKNVLFRFLPAFLVLAFLVPIPGTIRQAIAVPLQTATAATTQAIFETIAVPVERSGNLLIINGTEVAVAEACNGMRMVFALVLVSYAFAFSMPLRNSVRVLVLLASPVAAIACNVVRLVPTIWLYGYSTNRVADNFHDISGWVMLPVGFVLLLGIIRMLRWALIPVAKFNLAYQ